nr:hypothetical protein CFP56_04575 [Quercus suber]
MKKETPCVPIVDHFKPGSIRFCPGIVASSDTLGPDACFCCFRLHFSSPTLRMRDENVHGNMMIEHKSIHRVSGPARLRKPGRDSPSPPPQIHNLPSPFQWIGVLVLLDCLARQDRAQSC